MNKKQTRWRNRIILALVLFVIVMAVTELLPLASLLGGDRQAVYAEFVLFLIPYLIAGYDVLGEAARNFVRGRAFDESLLMSIATIGAFALVFFPDSSPHMAEGAAVMLFYQVGELFQSYAVGKSRKSIASMMDIAPEFANVQRNGEIVEVSPEEVSVGDLVIVKPGERIPVDGVVIEGASQIDTSALTGESVPARTEAGSRVISGCISMTGVLKIRAEKPYGESTVSRILELVENASEKKARTENFITRFARIYTPAVTVSALLLAVIPPLAGMGSWSDWALRGLTFLVVSCPCALVISVPLSFFGGIGGASRLGILVKGSNYLEQLSKVDTVVFDKTGTLTSGNFSVTDIQAAEGFETERLLFMAAHAEAFSSHPIGASIREAYGSDIDEALVSGVRELAGHGVSALVDGHAVSVGGEHLVAQKPEEHLHAEEFGTVVHVSIDGRYAGLISIADAPKSDSAQAISDLHAEGVKRCILLSGDRESVAERVGKALGIDEVHARLLPADKVDKLEAIMADNIGAGKVAFVGDGINDAPVLMRADVGVAMGAMGSDAAIEAADVVLMNDKPSDIVRAIRISRKTMSIVLQNIVFALGVKALILILAAVGVANMWLAVFGDVGVAFIAILNAMRCLDVRKLAN